jgi:ABC-type transport system involved in multi-copper enzyme maturation permease subunit
VHPATMTEPLSDLRQFRVAFLYQLRAYFRTWRFLGLLIFVILISVAILGVQVSRGADTVKANHPTASDELSSYLAEIGDAVIITAAFLGGDALAVDLGGGPGYLMLTQPVRRYTLLAGRFAAAAITGLAIALVYYAFGVAAVQYFYQTVPSAILVSLGCAFLFGLACLAVAFFFSSFFRNPSVSIIASLLILILGFPILTAVGELSGTEPWFSLDYGSTVITSTLSSKFSHEVVMRIVEGRATISLYTWTPYLWEGVAIMAAYLLIFLGLSYLVYRFKEVRA